jgi:pyruvate,water dikinase
MSDARLTPLAEAADERTYGGKATQLGAAIRASLPVPDGVAIGYRDIAAAKADRAALAACLARLGGLVAVRSSAIGEDSATASFAGQHATVLGVRDVDGLLAALDEVVDSAHCEAAITYRRKLGLDTDPRMGVVVQKLARADVAGVLFSRNPVTRADERVIEATWGLGEAVVQGLVTPDRYRLERGGRVLERAAGEKDVSIRWNERDGGSHEVPVAGELVDALCLDDAQLGALDALATRCEEVFGGTQDLEFAFEAATLFLLQRRAITRG